MIEPYRRTRDVPKRNTITSRLFRMAGRGVIYNVPGKKGPYSTYDVSEEEQEKDVDDSEADEATPAASASTPTVTPN